MSRRLFLRSAAATAGALAIPRVARAETSRLRVTRHRMPWAVPKRIRIAHLTDVHVGWTTPNKIIEDAVRLLHRLQPTMIAMTGDYVNHSLKHIDRLSAFVSRMPGPVLATLGNHDYWSGAAGVQEALEKGGAHVLKNQNVLVDVGGFHLPVVGVDDGRTQHDDVGRAFDGLPPGVQPLVLTHYPNTADQIAERANALVIAGHTHGGQVYLPGVTKLVSRIAGQRYLAGWYSIDDAAQLYVSAGIGASLDGLRGGRSAMPEIAVYDLVPPGEIDQRVTIEAGFDGRRLGRFSMPVGTHDDILRAVSDDL